jgi:hypothetical protein
VVDWAVPPVPAAATAGRQPRSPATKFGVSGAKRPRAVAGNDVIAMAEVVFYFFP